MPKRALLLLGFLLSAEFAFAQEAPPTTPKPNETKNAVPAPPPPAPKYPLEAWKPLISREGNFSILSPVALKGEAVRYQIQGGSAVESRFTIRTSDGNYQAAITFLSDNLATPEVMRERFATLLKNLKQNPKVKWISGGDITLEGNPGIEFKAQLNENQITTWSRQYFAFGCVYEVTARYFSHELELKEPQLFLDSFKLLGPPMQRPALAAPTQQSLPDFTPLAQNTYYVSAEKLRAQAIEKPEPKFDAERRAYSATVTLLVTVSPEGKVVQADPHEGLPGFYNDAIKAAKKWTFKPFLLNGKPVKVQGRLTFKFGSAGSQ